MHLKSIMLKGFKSFPDRTMLEFGSGVSVIVGPNGSGKSNITDAVLWALGEQSPLAVRGQSMQDVIFAGGEGSRSRSQCDVEVVLDNSDGMLASEFSEISISRHIDRSGEGVYRLNGARCRLVDVMEVLSDSGLGKEMHSVISQGRVEQIIHSKPADRTVLIEEAAGLSKHRKRRRRAQLKLERTQDNLNRALDVEREARSHLRPLKRQAEAAELHARVERQSLEIREQLTRDALLVVREELTEAERAAGEARSRRDELSSEQSEVGRRREQTERGLAEHGKAREQLASRLFATSSAVERITIRLESIRAATETLDARLERSRRAIEAISGGGDVAVGSSALEGLEAELSRLDQDRDARLTTELQEIERERQESERRATDLGERIEAKALELERAERAADDIREAGRRAGEQVAEATRKRAALEIELASIVERQQLVAGADRPSLAQKVTAEPGFETALAAALGGRLTAILVDDLGSGARAIERSSPEGGRVLVKGSGAGETVFRPLQPPVAGAVRLLDHLTCEPDVRQLVERLLGDAWVVDRIEGLENAFEGIAVTRAGIAYHGRAGELRRLPAGGPERVLAERSRRGEIEAALALVTADHEQGTAEAERAAQALRDTERGRDDLQAGLRELRREREEALEAARRAAWLGEQRRDLTSDPDTRRAQLMGEIAAERRLASSLARERSEREKRRQRLEASVERDRNLLPLARRLAEAMQQALVAVQERRTLLEQELSADQEVGERAAAELRRLAQSEYDLQARLREAGELLTQDEVKVAQIRDRETATSAELEEISQKLGEDASETPAQRLTPEERTEIEARLERLERRRERIGPVNPLAEGEYQEALEHVEDLERQRKDLEAALAELETLIRETDRRIRESFQETFEVTARNFEEVIQHLFPGGRGRLRLVKPPQPRVVLGGAEAEPDDEAPSTPEPNADPEAAIIAGGQAEDEAPRETPGVEIEVTPAGKSTKRLSLLSGGEKSLVALGFLFAVFLARPCPFYILDEVEAALDDRNIDRFLRLVKGYADRSQFIIITHQRRTMEAADVLYGVSMGGDGISKVVSRRLEREIADTDEALTEAA
jgi:chromosome segregation protein